MPDDKDPQESLSKQQYSQAMKRASLLDRAVDRVLQATDPTYTDRRLLSEQDAEFQRVIDRQLDVAKGVAGNQIVDFIASIRAQQDGKRIRPRGGNRAPSVDTADLFTQNVGEIFGYFQDIHKNRYLEVSDLKFISKFIPSLGESVRIYLDAIVSSDDVSQTITRNLLIPGISDDNSLRFVTKSIEALEDQYKIQRKLKVALRKTLITGSFYVYHIPYAELFGMYSRGLAEGKITKLGAQQTTNARMGDPHDSPGTISGANGRRPSKPNILGIAQESENIDEMASAFEGYTAPLHPTQQFRFEPAFESFGSEMKFLARDGLVYKANFDQAMIKDAISGAVEQATRFGRDGDGNPVTATEFTNKLAGAIEADLPNVYFVDTPIMFSAIDDTAAIATEGYNDFFNLRKDYATATKSKADVSSAPKSYDDRVPDGTVDPEDPTNRRRGQNFDGVSGTYLKWIDYKYVIPIEVLGQRVGYYHVIATPKNRKRRGRGSKTAGHGTEIGGILTGASMSLFDQMDISEKKKQDAIQNIVDTISGAIIDQFSVKFVKKNAAFKQLIAECIIANGLVDNDYMIQFIPVDNMIEFKCNEDENGHGESILSEAMFPAHLLLSIVITKMLNYINKGGNKTIAHISSGKVTKSLSNQVNRVIRDLQAGNVTFTDLLSSSMVFSKITRDSNIAMPKDLSGNRLVEFETQEGQDINLTTDYEQMLERWCMLATGIPPTAMDYDSNVEVAKKIVSDNIKVAGRVASLQSDVEDPMTELYRCLVEDSDMDDSLKNLVVGTLQVKLPRPRILANQNNSEALGTAYQNAQMLANVKVGEDKSDAPDLRVKAVLTEKIVRREVPFLDWDNIDELYLQAVAEVNGDKVKKNTTEAMSEMAKVENPDDVVSGIPGMDNAPEPGSLEMETGGQPVEGGQGEDLNLNI